MRIEHPAAGLWPSLALASVAALWGATFLLTQMGMDGAGPFSIVALRFGAAALILAALRPQQIRRITFYELKAGILLAAVALVGYGAQAVALQTAPSARVAFLAALYVPIVPVIGLVVWRRPVAAPVFIGALLALGGIVAMSHGGAHLGLSATDGLAALSAVSIVAEVFLLGLVMRRADPLRVSFVLVSAIALMAGGVASLSGEAAPRWDGSLLTVVAIFGIGTAYSQTIMGWGQARISPERASLLYATEPLWAGALGLAVGEALGTGDIVGGALIVMAVGISAMRRLPALPLPLRRSLRANRQSLLETGNGAR